MDLISGHSRPAYELASNLIEVGHNVRIFSSQLTPQRQRRHARLRDQESHLNLPSTERILGSTRSLIFPGRNVRRLLAEVGEWADIVHGFSFWGSSILVSRLRNGLPAVLSLTTLPKPASGELRLVSVMLRRSMIRRTELVGLLAPRFAVKVASRRYARLISWTEFLRRELVRMGAGPDVVEVIAPGIDLRRLSARVPRREGGPIVLYFGLVNSYRGALVALRAFERVLASEMGARLVIADRGYHQVADRSHLKLEMKRLTSRIGQANLRERVILEGFVSRVAPLIESADVVALPFTGAFGFSHPPLTVLESLAMGKPVISTNVGSLPEIIQTAEHGYLVPPGDHAALAEAIVEAWRTDGPEKRAARRQTIETKYNWAIATERILKAYRAAISA